MIDVEGIRRWLRLWQVGSVEMTSPLSLAEVEAALAASVETRRYGAWRVRNSTASHVVLGQLNGRQIHLSANPPAVRNSWNAVLRGELAPVADGCGLTARLGWVPSVRAFTAVWLAGVLAFFVLGVLMLVVSLANDDGTGGYVPMCLVPAAMEAFGVGLVGIAGSRGRDNAKSLRRWLRDTLQFSEDENRAANGPIHQPH
jgi:hypothetical protein